MKLEAMMELVEEAEADRQRRRRRQAVICFSIVAVFGLIDAFKSPAWLLLTAACGGYAIYLRQGGAPIIWFSLKPRKRSRAWFYYAIIALAGVVAAFSHPVTLLVSTVAGLYSIYLYRGGRFVLWIW